MAVVKLGPGRKVTLSILNGGTNSDVLDLGAGPSTSTPGAPSGSYRRWDAQIIALASAHTSTITPQISDTDDVSGTAAEHFRNLQSGAVDIVLIANKATPIIPIIGRYLRIKAASAEGAQRDFVLMFVAPR